MDHRVLSLLLAGTLALTLTACSGGGSAAPTPTPSPVAASAAVTPTATPAATPTPSPTPAPTPVPVPSPTPLPGPEEEPAGGEWLSVEAPSAFGMPAGSDCPLVVSAVRLEEDGLTVALLPAGSEAAFDAFIAAGERIPHTEITFDADAGALLLHMEGAALSSGEVTGDDWVFDFMGEHGMSYPVSTPAGAIPGDCPLVEKSAVSSDGADTVISLLLSGEGAEYRVETGVLDGDEMLPFFRLVLREAD